MSELLNLDDTRHTLRTLTINALEANRALALEWNDGEEILRESIA